MTGFREHGDISTMYTETGWSYTSTPPKCLHGDVLNYEMESSSWRVA
jgi:hypothetical protein